MSQSTNPAVVTLTVTAEAALFIIDCVADRPFKQVAPLLDELQAQVRTQANIQNTEDSGPAEGATGPGEQAEDPGKQAADASPAASGQSRRKRSKESAAAAAAA